jgi:hypothetical protein
MSNRYFKITLKLQCSEKGKNCVTCIKRRKDLAPQEVEIRKISVQSQPKQFMRSYLKKTHHKKGQKKKKGYSLIKRRMAGRVAQAVTVPTLQALGPEFKLQCHHK